MKTALFLLLFCCGAFGGKAQPAYLDSTFNGNGFVEDLTFGLHPLLHPGHIPAIRIQADGKILASVNMGSPYDRNTPGVIRVLPNGKKDSSFATNGIYKFNGQWYPHINDLVLHQNGNITVLCTDQSPVPGYAGTRIFLIRLRPNGTLDSSFGNNGFAIFQAPDFGLSTSEIRPFRLLERPNSKLVVAGWCAINGAFKPQHMLAQIKDNGTVDSAFGSNGLAWSKPDTTGWLNFSDAFLLPDGKILTTGRASYPNIMPKIVLTRFDTMGNTDLSFGMDGWVKTNIDSYSHCNGALIALRITGKILLGVNAGDRMFFQQFLPDGVLDNTFCQFGTLRKLGEDTTFLYGATRQILMLPDDRYIIAATTVSNASQFEEGENFTFLKIDSDGAVDSQWASRGIIESNFYGSRDFLYAAAIQSDGKIVAAGSSRGAGNSLDGYPILVRYKSNPRIPTGITKVGAPTEKDFFSIYPNPCTGSTTGKGSTKATLTLYDGLGRRAQTVFLNAGNGFQTVVANLVPGTYFVWVEGNNRKSFQKLVVTE